MGDGEGLLNLGFSSVLKQYPTQRLGSVEWELDLWRCDRFYIQKTRTKT